MTLRQLLIRHNWLNIQPVLLQQYPLQKKQIVRYEVVYQSLLLLEEGDTDLQVHLVARPEDNLTQNAIEVMGRKRSPSVAEVQQRLPYALHFTPWAEWLAMPVSLRSLAQFSEAEIVAHCLVEMTRKGFDEPAIQAQAQHLCYALDRMTKTGMLHL